MAKPQPIRQPVRDMGTSRTAAPESTASAAPAKRGMPSKVCPECGETIHAAKTTCPKCNHQFPPSERRGKGKGVARTGHIPDDIFELLDACSEYAQQFDDIDDAIAMVQMTARLIDVCGGSDPATAILEKMRNRRTKSE